ncbi:phosphatase PAP2 family protein [Deminuibacter soli]|uniref:PAP2 family protein n=1 Tax=Deminuibacter soli TaxID=2291815 RepID=A0A3E1NQB7_9BACT|nr:phosphatase PAP2 family protein [Deminuibacter soli]RFM30149.1 PAP2 family protein [Deminuibacter soli]
MFKYLLLLCAGIAMCRSVHAQNLDVDILKHINPSNGHYSGVMTGISNSAYNIGIGVPVALTIGGFVSGNKDLGWKGLRIAETVAISSIVTELAKRAASRNRPSFTYKGIIHAYSPGNDDKSMPSGHTSLAFSLATSVTLEFKKWYIAVPAYVWAGSVAYSRMYLGAHYPSDVFAGAVVGTGTAFATRWLNKKLFNRPKPVLRPLPE